MKFRLAPIVFMLTSCLILASGCTSGKSGVGSMFTKTTPEEPAKNYAQEISMARLAERHGNHVTAKKIYRHILSQEPENQIALHRMGVVAGKEGQYSEAVEYLTKASSVEHPTAEILSDLGYLYYLQDNQQMAQQYLEEALTEDPDYNAARTNLAIVYAENGEYDRALQYFRATSGEAEALSNLAYIQSQRGDLDLAEQNYSRALDIDKKLRPAAEALVQIAQAKGEISVRPEVGPEAIQSPGASQELIAEVDPAATNSQPIQGQRMAIPAAQDFIAKEAQQPATQQTVATQQPAATEAAPVRRAPVVVVKDENSLQNRQPLQQARMPNYPSTANNPLRTSLVEAQANEATVQQAQFQGAGGAQGALANSGLRIPAQNMPSSPAVIQVADLPDRSAYNRPPAASSQIGAVPSASAETFSQQIFNALETAAGTQ